jgi:predicted ATPase
MLGYPDQALDKALEMLHLADEQSHPFSQSFALFVVARLHQFRREAAPAQQCAEQLIAISKEQEFSYRLAQGNILRGWASVKQGAAEEGIARMREGLDAWRSTGAEGVGPYYLALLAEAYGSVGQIKQAFDTIADAKAMAEKNSERNYQAELYRLEGELLLAQGASDADAQAGDRFRHALEIARGQRARSLELRAAVSIAMLLRRQGKRNQAHGLVAEAFGWFSEGFDTADLKEANALLKQLS